MQHAGTAATALIAALAHIPDATDRTNNMQYLEVLHAALQDMAHAYHPAERMAAVLNAVMIELRGGPISPGKGLSMQSSTIPARRDSTALDAGAERPTVAKRRQLSRTSKPRAMGPPTTKARAHRASDASDQHSVNSQSHQQHSDFVMVTPSTEGSTWPNVHNNDDSREQHMSDPDTANIATSFRRNDWMSGQLGNSDFPQMPDLTNLPGLGDGQFNNLEFLTLPSEEDWDRWNAAPGDVSTDLDGFPPRGRYQAHDFASPPMGGIVMDEQ